MLDSSASMLRQQYFTCLTPPSYSLHRFFYFLTLHACPLYSPDVYLFVSCINYQDLYRGRSSLCSYVHRREQIVPLYPDLLFSSCLTSAAPKSCLLMPHTLLLIQQSRRLTISVNPPHRLVALSPHRDIEMTWVSGLA